LAWMALSFAAADPAAAALENEIAGDTVAATPEVRSASSSFFLPWDTCSPEEEDGSVAAGMEMPTTEDLGRAALCGPVEEEGIFDGDEEVWRRDAHDFFRGVGAGGWG
jgi:hypothetical protein